MYSCILHVVAMKGYCTVVFVTLNDGHSDIFWFKDAKVWIPDASVVWKCASLLDDYKGPQQTLRVCYEEDGTVSMYTKLLAFS